MWIEYNQFSLSDGGRYALNVKNSAALQATEYKNCITQNGAVFVGYGLESVKNKKNQTYYVNSNIKCLLVAERKDAESGEWNLPSYIASDGALMLYSNAESQFKRYSNTTHSFKSLYRNPNDDAMDCVYALSEKGLCVIDSTGVIYERLDPTNSVGCFFADRFFYANGGSVCFSDVGACTDFTETSYGAGKIAFGGSTNYIAQLIVYDEAILVFSSDAIWRFNAKGAAVDFSVEKLDYHGGKILPLSVARCGDYVVFVTRSGDVVRLHGKTFKRIARNVPDEFFASTVRAAGDGEYYFLGYKSKTLLVDVNEGSCCTMYGLEGLTSNGGDVFGMYQNRVYRLMRNKQLPSGQASKFVVKDWLAKENVEYRLAKVRLYGVGEVFLTISCGDQKAYQTVALCESGVEVPVGIKGKKFDLEMTLKINTRLWKMEALVYDLAKEKTRVVKGGGVK